MNDFKLKLFVAVFSGIAFSFIFILLAFSLPNKGSTNAVYKPKGKLEEISHSAKNN